MQRLNIQQTIFDQIKAKSSNPRKWIEEVASVLNRSKNSIYKKVSGEVALSLEEVALLSEHFQLYLDPILRPGKTMTFEFPFGTSNGDPVEAYFRGIRNHIDFVLHLQNPCIHMSSVEIPFIHDYNFPEIVAFKFYIHNKTLWQSEETRFQKFSFADTLQDYRFQERLQEILTDYYRFDSVEYWNDMILNVTLSQIKYVLESGLFEDPGDALILCDRLLDFVNHMQEMATSGYKKIQGDPRRHSGEFMLYHNELAHSTNLLLIESAEQNLVFVIFGNPQFMYSTSVGAVDYVRQWFEMMRSNAEVITRESRKSRLAFFNALRRRVDEAKTGIQSLINILGQ